jgi:RNA polymerase sigma factor (sigma-70 family)
MTDFSAQSDEDLMQTYYDADDDAVAHGAFAELDRRYRVRLILSVTAPGYNSRFIKLHRMPGLEQKGEDLVAEALVKVADSKGRPSARWDRTKPLRPWLFGILHNVVASYLRRKPLSVRTEADIRPADDRGESADTLGLTPDPRGGPDEAVQHKHALEALRHCRAELPDELRRLCELLFDEERKQTEIAGIMKLTTPTLTRRKQEMCARLRECLRRKGVLQEGG